MFNKNIILSTLFVLSTNSYSEVNVKFETINSLSYVNLSNVSELYSDVKWSEDKKEFTIKRNVDDSEFVLNTENGAILWKNKIISYIPNAPFIIKDKNLFPVNVIESLTGTIATLKNDTVTFDYSPQLRPKYWTLLVGGELITSNIKSIGNTLLFPIDLIAKKLGSTVDFIGNTIIYQRLQDNAKIEINLETGIVKVNGTVLGIVGNLFYVNTQQKMVPANIAEILAGILIDVDNKTNTISIELDPRIARTAFGSKLISEEVKNTPFTAQSLKYDIKSDGNTSLSLDMYMSSYNGRLNYQSGSGIFDKNGAKPALLNFQWNSYDGSSGTIGDINLTERELSGININRIQGIEYSNITQDGNYKYSLVAGQIIQNNNKIVEQNFNNIKNNSNYYTPIEYGGAAYGLRIYPKNKPYEFGLSILDDPQQKRKWSILSYVYKSNNQGKEPWNYYLSLDGGQLSNFLNESYKDSGLDIKGSWSLSKTYKDLNIYLDGNYSGEKFEQYYQPTLETLINNSNGIGNNPLSPLLPNIDNFGYSKFSQNAGLSYNISDKYSVSYALNYNQRKNSQNTYDYHLHNIGFTRRFENGSISLNNLSGKGNDISGDYKVDIYNLTAQQKLGFINVMGRYDYNSVNKDSTGQINLQLEPIKNDFKNFTGVFSSNITYNFSHKANTSQIKNSFLNLNYTLNSQSYNGWRFTGGVGTSVKLYDNNENNFIYNEPNGFHFKNKKVNPFAFLNLNYSISKALRLNISTSYDSYSKGKIFFGISGDLDYAPARPVSQYLPNKGVLRGKVFIDENEDGIRQDSENIPISVPVKIKGTSLALDTDNSGNFTIQNLTPGLYELIVSMDRLPLGWSLNENATTTFSIREDNITEMSIPIQRVYNIIGQAISKSKHEEGLTVQVFSGDKLIKSSLTTFGGQFAFDNIKRGNYTVKIFDFNEKIVEQNITLDENKSPKMFFNLD